MVAHGVEKANTKRENKEVSEMRWEDQKFSGILKDKELYLIEDALEYYKSEHKEQSAIVDKLVLKLYKFWQ